MRSFVLAEREREHLYDALLGKKTGILKIHTSCQGRYRLRPTAARLSSKFDFYLFEAGDCSCHTNKSKEKLSSCSPSDKGLFFKFIFGFHVFDCDGRFLVVLAVGHYRYR